MADLRYSDLLYPLYERPTSGQGDAVEFGPGMLWLKMPMLKSLGDINIWAIEEDDGWAIIDAGMRTPESPDAWERAIEGPLRGRPVRRVLATHMHPDHAGMLGWLHHRFDAELWMTRNEYLTFRMMSVGREQSGVDNMFHFYRAAGWEDADIYALEERFDFGALVCPPPERYRRISHGEHLTIGAHRWEVLVGGGHTPEHASFYSKELGLLIAGDQILPNMSSNVSVIPHEPEGDPLGEWLTSLEMIRANVPDDVLVLPAHGDPFHGLHARVNRIIAGHERKLESLSAGLDIERRAIDAIELVFRRPMTGGLVVNATGEVMAHLHYLRSRGLAQRRTDDQNVYWWKATRTALSR